MSTSIPSSRPVGSTLLHLVACPVYKCVLVYQVQACCRRLTAGPGRDVPSRGGLVPSREDQSHVPSRGQVLSHIPSHPVPSHKDLVPSHRDRSHVPSRPIPAWDRTGQNIPVPPY